MVFRKSAAGISAFLTTEIILLYTDIVCVYYIIEYEGMAYSIASYVMHILYLLAVVSHLRAAFTNPGYVRKFTAKIDSSFKDEEQSGKKRKKKELVSLDEWSVCSKCEAYRPPRSHHCRVCGCCVRRMDHHCAWINNCVGELNYKFFVLFVFYSDIILGYSLSLIFWDWIYNTDTPSDRLDKVLTVSVLVIIILFCFFINGMLVAQCLGLFCDRTFVETKRYGRPVGWPKKTRYELVSAVFGRNHTITWFLPCFTPRIPDPVFPTELIV